MHIPQHEARLFTSMRANIPFITEKFHEYNELFFGGKLPTVPILLSQAKTYIGICMFKKKTTFLHESRPYDFKLCFSTRLDLPQNVLEDTIIHEMIHLYIGVNNIKDSSPHGNIFKSFMHQINEKFGRNISISHKATPEQKQSVVNTRVQYHVIAVVKFTDGRKGIKVLPRILQRIDAYYRAIIKAKGVASIDFYMSKDPFFNSYPNSGAFKVYAIKPEELAEHLADAELINNVCSAK